MIVGSSVKQLAAPNEVGRIGRRYVASQIQRATVEQSVGRLSRDELVLDTFPVNSYTDVSTALTLIAELDARDLSTPGSVSTWTARTGPDWVQDTSLAYGLPVWSATSFPGNKPGLTVTRGSFPRLMAGSSYATSVHDRTIVIVHSPSSATATATTRGYLFGSTDDNTIQGTRFIVPHHANTAGNYDHGGFFIDDGPNNPTGQNPGWHWFYDETGAGTTLVVGAQISIWSFGCPSFWMRNGVIVGFDNNAEWRARPRSSLFKSVLWADHTADLTSTATYYDGVTAYFADYYGAANYAQALAIHNALAAIWL